MIKKYLIIIYLLTLSCSNPISIPRLTPMWPTVMAHWTFNGDLLDYSGMGNDLTGNNITPNDFKSSNLSWIGQYLALDFEHKNQFCYRTNPEYMNLCEESYTIEIIFKVTNNNINCLIYKWQTCSGGYSITTYNNKLYIKLGTECQTISENINIKLNKWYYLTIAIDRDNNLLKL